MGMCLEADVRRPSGLLLCRDGEGPSCTLYITLGARGRLSKDAGGAFELLMLMLMLVYVLVRKDVHSGLTC